MHKREGVFTLLICFEMHEREGVLTFIGMFFFEMHDYPQSYSCVVKRTTILSDRQNVRIYSYSFGDVLSILAM